MVNQEPYPPTTVNSNFHHIAIVSVDFAAPSTCVRFQDWEGDEKIEVTLLLRHHILPNNNHPTYPSIEKIWNASCYIHHTPLLQASPTQPTNPTPSSCPHLIITRHHGGSSTTSHADTIGRTANLHHQLTCLPPRREWSRRNGWCGVFTPRLLKFWSFFCGLKQR